MKKTSFRVALAGLAVTNLLALSPFGALFGFIMIWVLLLAAVPVLSLLGAAGVPKDTISIGLKVIGALYGLNILHLCFQAFRARTAGLHDRARSLALTACLLTSLVSVVALSVKSMADAWP